MAHDIKFSSYYICFVVMLLVCLVFDFVVLVCGGCYLGWVVCWFDCLGVVWVGLDFVVVLELCGFCGGQF